MQRICVYCGSSTGRRPVYAAAAVAFADALVENGIDLVYGGASRGIMGIIADRLLERGGRVYGVIPTALRNKEIAHEGLTELHIVETMHERKSMMEQLSDGFVAMPGGFGTLEELIEILTWAQLRFHDKPVGLLNVDTYFDRLLGYLDHAVDEGFLRPENREMLIAEAEPAALIRAFEEWSAPQVEKWMS